MLRSAFGSLYIYISLFLKTAATSISVFFCGRLVQIRQLGKSFGRPVIAPNAPLANSSTAFSSSSAPLSSAIFLLFARHACQRCALAISCNFTGCCFPSSSNQVYMALPSVCTVCSRFLADWPLNSYHHSAHLPPWKQ